MPYRRVADLTPEERVIRRKWWRAKYYDRRRADYARCPLRAARRRERELQNALARLEGKSNPDYRDMVKAERALARGFRCGMDVDELYQRWATWKTAERLLDLSRAQLEAS